VREKQRHNSCKAEILSGRDSLANRNVNFWFHITQYVLLNLHGCLDKICLLDATNLTYVASQQRGESQTAREFKAGGSYDSV